ncbi:hypothetical protein ACTOB_006421 [Actinoplanes oblitus]|uniref:Tryptophan 2,3-dioxygenase n=1 Tax=Actinoplanes oblitus TaxID=3040509 RepID=A0ABY8WBC9_9ACTN|nr:hypothetical protein [Actinoplanes oblitus]WIM94398.1 hypothetical protein ACTOB_006421 [Actinoplanes oblitus]
MPEETLAALDKARSVIPGLPGAPEDARLLSRFLATALDKWDKEYDYRSYLALELLALHGTGDPATAGDPVRRRDLLVVHLLADVLRFELAALDGLGEHLPQMRPEQSVVVKRCRLALRVARPAMRRLGLDDGLGDDADPVAAGRRLWAVVDGAITDRDRRILRLSLQPAYVIHDEYLFLRVLQAFEATFAMLVDHLRDAVAALEAGAAGEVERLLGTSTDVFRESALLFSLLATMQVKAFQTFRDFTEGASAIQSRSYKILESLCRMPDQDRLDSAAYLSVPEVRTLVLAGQANLDDMFEAVVTGGRLDAAGLHRVERAMREFAAALLRWRNTHTRIAIAMLGERLGTGYTAGTPYLKAVRDIPVFPRLAPIEATGSERGD